MSGGREPRSVAVLAAFAVACAAHAQTDESLLLKPFQDGRSLEAESSVIWAPRSTLGGSTGRTGMLEVFSTGRVRLSADHELNPVVGFDFTRLQFRDRSERIPAMLTDQSIGLASPLGQIGDWFIAIGAGGGYAGDEAYGNPGAWYGKGQFTVGRRLNEKEDLVFWVDYDGNRTFFPDVPLPCVAYSRKVGTDAELVLGFPASEFDWGPSERFHIDLSWEAPLTFGARAELRLSKAWSLRALYASDESAFHASGAGSTDRLFYQEQRLELGVSCTPVQGLSVTAGVGLAFARSFSTGFDDRNQSRIAQVPDRAYLRGELSFEF